MAEMRKTKIICTLGPASSKRNTIKGLMLAGMNIARLNFSHGTHQEHRAYSRTIQELSRELRKPVGILQDLEGYKIRTRSSKDGETLYLKEGDNLWIVPESQQEKEEKEQKEKWVSISYPDLYRFAKPGDRIFVDDGKIELQVEKISGNKIKTKTLIGGPLEKNKGIHLPGADPDFPSLTEKDKKDIYFGIDMGVDYIGQSFVREAKDILTIKDILTQKGREDIGVIAKIEDARGINNIDEIIKVADGIMIARGDMGVCLPRSRVPLIQKMIIRKCNRAGKPVITATQMLDSMIHNHRPTRAEVTDVANAIIDGTDLVMLSGETATGSYPVQAVKEIHQIAKVTEASLHYGKLLQEKGIVPHRTISDSIAFATRQLAELTEAGVIMAFTLSGTTARMVSKYRPEAKILAVTPESWVAKNLLLYWGIEVMMVKRVKDIERHFTHFLKQAVNKRFIDKGKLVVATCGIKKEANKPTGTIRILST